MVKFERSRPTGIDVMKYVLWAFILGLFFITMLLGLVQTFQPANLVYGVFLLCVLLLAASLIHVFGMKLGLLFAVVPAIALFFCVKGVSGLINHSIGSDDQRTFIVNSKSGSLIHGRGSSCLFDMNNRRLCLDFIKTDDWKRSCAGAKILLKGKSSLLGFSAVDYEILDFGCTGH